MATAIALNPALYLGKIAFTMAFDDWCPTYPRRWPFPPRGGNIFTRPPPLPWFQRLLGNVKYAVMGAMVIATAVAHPEETFSGLTGPFLLAPVVQIVIGSYWVNAGGVAREDVEVEEKDK